MKVKMVLGAVAVIFMTASNVYADSVWRGIRHNSYEEVKAALENGADVNEKGDYKTPLYAACLKVCKQPGIYTDTLDVNRDIIKLLIDNGADLKIKYAGNTILHEIFEKHHEGKIFPERYTPIRYNQSTKDQEKLRDLVKYLLDFGVNPTIKSYAKVMPICMVYDPELFSYMLTKVKKEDLKKCANELLYASVYYRNKEAVKLVLDNGADPNLKVTQFIEWTGHRYDNDFPILLMALCMQDKDIIHLLIEHGADTSYEFNHYDLLDLATGDGTNMGRMNVLKSMGVYDLIRNPKSKKIPKKEKGFFSRIFS